MKKNKEKFTQDMLQTNTIMIDYTILCNMQQRIDDLEKTLKNIREVTERNQYGRPEIALKLIQEKVNKVL